MMASIVHRATGVALSFAGLAILTWWLFAIAHGADAYSGFTKASNHPIGIIVLIGLTWSFFQHLLSGIRQLVEDSGSGLEIRANSLFAILTFVGGVVLTAAMWIYLLGVRP